MHEESGIAKRVMTSEDNALTNTSQRSQQEDSVSKARIVRTRYEANNTISPTPLETTTRCACFRQDGLMQSHDDGAHQRKNAPTTHRKNIARVTKV